MELSVAGVSVWLATPTHRDIPPETVRSLLETQAECFRRGIGLGGEFGKGSSLVHNARSKIAWAFLQSDCTHLFWIDSDMVWSAESFLRILALGTVKDVVAAAYPPRHATADWFFRLAGDEVEADEYGCLPGKWLGLGFTCMQRHVVEELAARAPRRRFRDMNNGEAIPHLFRLDDEEDGFGMGEDSALFADVRALGYRVNIDPTIVLGHVGQFVFTGRLLDQLSHAPTTDQPA